MLFRSNPKDFFHKEIIRARSDISFKKQQRTIRLIIRVGNIPVRRRNGGKTGSIELEGVILVTASQLLDYNHDERSASTYRSGLAAKPAA